MVARLCVIFGDGMKNFLDGDLLVGAVRFNREVDVFVPLMHTKIFRMPPAQALFIPIGSQREIASTWASCDIKDDGQRIPSPCVFTSVSVLPK
jgi:hypothetical protein